MRKALTAALVLVQLMAMAAIAQGEENKLQPYEKIEMAAPEGQSVISMGVTPEGAILALARDKDRVTCMLRWKSLDDAPEVIPLELGESYVFDMDIAADGQILIRMQIMRTLAQTDAQGPNQSTKTSYDFLWMDATGKETARLTIESDSDFIRETVALPDRRIAMMGMADDLVIYDEKGEELCRMPPMQVQRLVSNATTLYGLSYESLQSWSLDTYEKLPKQDVTWSYYQTATFSPDGKLYAIAQEGIYELDPSEGKAILRMDALGTPLGDPDMYVQGFGALQGGAFAMLARVSSQAEKTPMEQLNKLFVYRPLEGIEARTPFVITSLFYTSQLIQKAASEFQAQHPELDVQIRELGSRQSGGGLTTEDITRALNTELMAGGGGDVLLVDQMPYKSMIKRGMLRDLSHLMPELGLVLSFAEGAKHPDGKVYVIPSEFRITLLWGSKETISAIQAFTDIPNAPIAPEKKRLSSYSIENVVSQFASSCMLDFMDDQGQLDFAGENFITYLETLYAMASDMEFPEQTDDGMAKYEAHRLALQNGNFALYPQNTGSLFDLDEMFTIYGGDEGSAILMPSMHAPGKAYEPTTQLAIPVSTRDAALSEAFIRLVFSEAITQELFPSYSTVEAKLDKMFDDAIEETKSEHRSITTRIESDGRRWEMLPLSEAFLTHVRAQIGNLTTTLNDDSTIMAFILEETKPFFEGSITAKAAAEAITQRAWLYLNE